MARGKVKASIAVTRSVWVRICCRGFPPATLMSYDLQQKQIKAKKRCRSQKMQSAMSKAVGSLRRSPAKKGVSLKR